MEMGARVQYSQTEWISSNLPDEIVENILSRLPVKSLLRFSCVSKPLYSLIGSKSFIRTHLENSMRNPTLEHHRIIMRCCPFSSRHDSYLRHCSLPSVMNESVACIRAFDDPFLRALDGFYSIVGCCDGLVCLLGQIFDQFFLWNPSTGVSRELPSIDYQLDHSWISWCGFGLDQTNDDYKVFAVLENRDADYGYSSSGRIYSLKSNSWNEIKFMDGVPMSRAGTFANGKLYWLRKEVKKHELDIVTFDLTNEVYGIMQLSAQMEPKFQPGLANLGGCLSLLCSDQTSRMDVWALKQCGVKESWHKILSFSYDWNAMECALLEPLFIGENGEILLHSLAFMIYSPKGKRFRHPDNGDVRQIHTAHVYIESLVSPISNNKHQRLT